MSRDDLIDDFGRTLIPIDNANGSITYEVWVDAYTLAFTLTFSSDVSDADVLRSSNAHAWSPD